MTAATESFDRELRFGLRRPSRVRKYLEIRSVFEALLLLPAAPMLLSQPRGDNRRVMLVPGFGTDDGSTWALRRYLCWLGYDAIPWELGRNVGNPEQDAERVIMRMQAFDGEAGPTTLIGWSLGGVVAREAARQEPALVREVITFGTPVEGGPKYTATGDIFARRKNVDLDEIERRIHDINEQGLICPVTVIYSRGDGVVDWRSSIDRYNDHAVHKRVIGSHLGMGFNALVWRAVARTLGSSRS